MTPLLLVWVDKTPTANDTVAGWGAFWIFVGGCVAVALLGWSLVRQLRKAQAAADAGLYDEPDPHRRGGYVRPAQPPVDDGPGRTTRSG